MTTLAHENTTSSRTLLQPNPVLRRLSKADDRAATNTATYQGIAAKTCFFLALTMIGIIAQLRVSAAGVADHYALRQICREPYAD